MGRRSVFDVRLPKDFGQLNWRRSKAASVQHVGFSMGNTSDGINGKLAALDELRPSRMSHLDRERVKTPNRTRRFLRGKSPVCEIIGHSVLHARICCAFGAVGAEAYAALS